MADSPKGIEQKIWTVSSEIPDRVKKLRDEYFSFYDRDYYRNEVKGYSTGMEWDIVFSPHQWGVVPEMYPLFAAFEDSLAAGAQNVEVPVDFWDKSIIMRRSIFFDIVIKKYLPIKVLNGELIVGSYFNTALSKCLNRQETKEWLKLEKKWSKLANFIHFNGIGNAGAIPGHIIPNYPKVLSKGFKGIKSELEKMIKESQDPQQIEFLQALIICCDTAKAFAERYAKETLILAELEKNPDRKEELEEIARICNKVPWEPAESFYEALQSLWFTHILVIACESYPGPGLSYGRFDQYMYPYYERDIKDGKITREFAKELLQCYWIKHNYVYDFHGRVGENQGINSGFGQLITLSGMGPNGEDLTNDLTWLILEVIEEMNMLEPKPNIRIHKNTPDELLERICELIANAQGSPFLINFDENAIRGLKWEGQRENELWNYASVGCLENTLQGCERAGTVDVNVNLAKALEITLNNGKDILNNIKIGPKTGIPNKFKNFNDFYTAFKKQLTNILDIVIENANIADEIRSKFEPTPYLSTLIDGCAENGKDITAGGAKYNFITVEAIALATVIDSLMAIKKLIYEQEKIKMEELVKAIKDNFEGHERIRQLLMNRAPKYGNDIDEVNKLGRELSEFWSKYVFTKKSPSTNRNYRGGYLSWNYWISYAPFTAATPDGRKCGIFLSNALCPVNGMDKKGPTSVINSVGKLNLETIPNGGSHTLTLNPSILKNKEHLEKLKGLIKAYREAGGTCLQLNILEPETLIAAQKNPELYSNLLVRVTGYNAYFVSLGVEIQNEIINRLSHQL
ncbi:MAG: pyruvate formate lyase family protein [Candidatus Helarchaeota archaeon]